MVEMIKKKCNYLVIIGSCLLVICGLLYSHYDCNAITKWGVILLDAIRNGDLSNYPQLVKQEFGFPTNYTLFVNCITAIWISPLYFLMEFVFKSEALVIYDVWYHLLLITVILLDVKVLGMILRKLHFQEDDVNTGRGLFLVSSIVLLATVGKGQIDAYGVLFLLLGIHAHLKQEKYRMSLFMGLAILVKPLVLWIVLPYYLLMISSEKGNIVKYGVMTMLPFLLDKIITSLIMPGYFNLSKETAEMLKDYFGGPSMFESMFINGVNGVLGFWLIAFIVCFVCYYKGIHNMTKEWHYYVFPTVLLIAFAIFASVSYQWFIYLLPFFIAMGLHYASKADMYLLMLGVNSSLTAYFLVGEKLNFIPTLQGSIHGETTEMAFWGMQILQNERWMLFPLFKTIFFVCILVIDGLFIYEMYKKGEVCDTNNTYVKILKIVQPLPVIGYIGLSVIKYMTELNI